MRFFITGGTGFIGRNLSEYLGKDHTVLSPRHSELELLDANAVQSYIERNDIDIILHCANRGGTRDMKDASGVVEDNLRAFFNIARNAESVDKIIYFGSGAEYGKDRDLKKVGEDEFGRFVPKDQYGFYKYVCSRYAEKSRNIINLRLFGVFGRYEDYRLRFISNAILKNLLGEDIRINQDVVFDYLYIDDLMGITEYFIRNKTGYGAYNVTPDDSISLMEISGIINGLSNRKSRISVMKKGMNFEYSGSNRRLNDELGGYRFTDYRKSIGQLISYYSDNLEDIDREAVIKDAFLEKK